MSVSEMRCPECGEKNTAGLVSFDDQARDVYMCHSCEYRGLRKEFLKRRDTQGAAEIWKEKPVKTHVSDGYNIVQEVDNG